jgi:undecaprenyl-phosphate 4-deoxy-4-formamido-L-arabinose transferase
MQLSIVVPVYQSAECLPELALRVQQEVSSHFEKYELILVNDNSPDTSWDVILQLADQYDFITGVNLRKNVGQDNAIMAGLHYARGEVVIIMDDDLQHDPSDIPSLYEEAQNGFDVVYAHFKRKKQAFWKNVGSWFTDRVAMLMLGKPKRIYMSPYKAIRREVIDELIKYDGPYSYVDGLIFTITSNLTQIPATHHARFAGAGNYNLLKSIGVWLKLATCFSAIPLRIAMVVGGIISALSFVMGCYFLLKTLLWEQMPEGWPSLIVAVFFLGGIQLMGIGAVGEYIARIFITQNKRPQFTVKAIHRSTKIPKTQDIRSGLPLGLVRARKD